MQQELINQAMEMFDSADKWYNGTAVLVHYCYGLQHMIFGDLFRFEGHIAAVWLSVHNIWDLYKILPNQCNQ